MVAAENTLSKILDMLEDKQPKVVRIYGNGGIGKTTLLKKLNNLFEKKSEGFDVVIFVTVTKDVRIEKIQKEITELPVFKSQDTSDVATKLYNTLVQKKFLLLLEDLWEKLDLDIVGIPFPPISKEGSKIVFTSRFQSVCADMDTSKWKVEVPYLSPESSWMLFCQSVGKREEDKCDGDAPSQQQQLRERQRPPIVFTNTLLANSVSQVVTALIRTVRSEGL